MKVIDINNHVFNGVKVVSRHGLANGKATWECLCPCGEIFIALGTTLRNGKTKGCRSCNKSRVISAITKHGYSGTREYHSYNSMKERCYNPKNKRFSRYGGRGIKVCDKWLNSFSAFIADMGDMPGNNYTLERLNFDLDYCPENCVWATKEQQANNRSNNHFITIDGKTMTLTAWSRKTNIHRSVLLRRIRRGLKNLDLIKKHHVQKIVAFGIVDTASGWSRKTGIKASTISARIRTYGFSHEKAVSRITK